MPHFASPVPTLFKENAGNILAAVGFGRVRQRRPRTPRSRRRTLFLAVFLGVLAACACTAILVWQGVPDPLPAVRSWPVSPVLLDRNGTLIHARLSADREWCLPVPLDEMGEWLPRVLVAVEDKRFHQHNGVDLLALGRATFQNIIAGRVVSGASTISSQLVRLSTPRPRTAAAKVLEFVGAWKLERTLSKREILEYYLNRAPFGGPIRGVEAAARLYFNKRARELSLGEAALLVGLLKGPTAYRPDRNPKAALRRRQQIIRRVAEQTNFPRELTALALEEPLPRFRPSMPAKAWHFADLAFTTLPRKGGIVHGTLDLRLQELLERCLAEQLRHAGENTTAAGVIVENASAAIVAYVGNARFNPVQGIHWVDCAIAPRSPGSTLKPFIYLAAMQDGNIIPASLLADTPLQLGGEAPRNFDRQYRGPVSAHTALASSLNTPAVRVLRMVGVGKALRMLRTAGFTHLNREDEEYGDSLVLGAGEVTVLELARAYTTLAALGQDRPLLLCRRPGPGAGDRPAPGARKQIVAPAITAYRPNDRSPVPLAGVPMPILPLPGGLADLGRQLRAAASGDAPAPKQAYSPGAAFLIAEILKDPGRLPLLAQLTQAREDAPAAFKTGTSFGLRDAWTAAYTPTHTVVVWFGREDGKADSRLLGIAIAAPAALKILRELSANTPRERGWYESPQETADGHGVGKVRVCALSGAAPSAYCPSTRETWHIPAVWRTTPCSMHVLREGRRVLVWPPELEDFNRKRFAGEDLSRSVLIVSPMPGARYLITPGGSRLAIPLKAEGVAYPVHWYVDGEYLGKQEREDLPLYWQPTGGEHSVSLLDARERIASATTSVTDLGAVSEAPPALVP